jgi:WD40 repeat protein
MTLNGHKATVRTVCFDPNNEQHLFSGGMSEYLHSTQETSLTLIVDQTIRMWDTENGKTIKEFEGHENAICSIKVKKVHSLIIN